GYPLRQRIWRWHGVAFGDRCGGGRARGCRAGGCSLGCTNANARGHDERNARNVILVPHEKLEGMRPRRKRNLPFRLAGIEVKMMGIIGYGLIERWKLGIHEEVVMTRILTLLAGRCDAHAAQPEPNRQLCRDGAAVLA